MPESLFRGALTTLPSGNRREAIFFEEGDQTIYPDLLAEQTARHEVQVRAYCLMPNHVHLILVPAHADELGLALGEAHRRYTNFISRADGCSAQRAC